MIESSDFDDYWTTKQIRRRVSVGCEASTRIAALIQLQIEMVDAGRVPVLCACGSDAFKICSICALEDRVAGISIDVYCRPVPVSGRSGWQWLFVEVVVVRTGHDLDVSNRVIVEQISVHVAVMLHVAGK